MKRSILISALFVLLAGSGISQITENTWQDGDIIFIKNPSMPSNNAQGDKKNFNCVGLILHEGEHAYVYFVDDKLKKVSFDEFVGLSEGKKYSVKWLVEKELVTPEVASHMKTWCSAKLGIAKDTQESLNSDELYNAEFVWKIYTTTLGVKLCEPKELSANSDPKSVGSGTGYANKSVSVRDIYRSEILE